MRTYKIVKVEWVDSANCSGWKTRAQTKAYSPMTCTSCGVLVKTQKGCIGVTHSISEMDDFSETMVIPRKVIQKIEVLQKFRK